MASKNPDPNQPPSVVEVEVERLPLEHEQDAGARRAAKRTEVGKVIGPVLAGLAIDVVDAITPSPILGIALGWPLGTYIARQAGAPPRLAFQLGLIAGLYCAVPMTAGLPIGTMIGLITKVRRALK